MNKTEAHNLSTQILREQIMRANPHLSKKELEEVFEKAGLMFEGKW